VLLQQKHLVCDHNYNVIHFNKDVSYFFIFTSAFRFSFSKKEIWYIKMQDVNSKRICIHFIKEFTRLLKKIIIEINQKVDITVYEKFSHCVGITLIGVFQYHVNWVSMQQICADTLLSLELIPLLILSC
jgi:hypothetical protein